MATDTIVIVIYCNEDGDRYFERMRKSTLLSKLKDNHWGRDIKFATSDQADKGDLGDAFVGLIVIDGDVVVPRAVSVTTEYSL